MPAGRHKRRRSASVGRVEFGADSDEDEKLQGAVSTWRGITKTVITHVDDSSRGRGRHYYEVDKDDVRTDKPVAPAVVPTGKAPSMQAATPSVPLVEDNWLLVWGDDAVVLEPLEDVEEEEMEPSSFADVDGPDDTDEDDDDELEDTAEIVRTLDLSYSRLC